MKKFFTLSFFSLTLGLLVSSNLKAQNTYFAEGFENSTGNINSSSTLAPTTAAPDTADNGIWTLYEVYRTSSSGCPGYGGGHIRFIKETDGTKPWLASPDLAFGVNTVHFSSIGTNKVVTLQYTTGQFTDQDGAGVSGATWVTVSKTKVTTCTDTVVTINNPLARRIRFIDDTSIVGTGYQVDIDSITITSTSTIVPVKFGNISTSSSNGIVKVSWNVANEAAATEYIVERSSDGQNFHEVGSLNATNSTNYTYFDNSPLAGTSYYRIKEVDNNTAVFYSSVAKVSSAAKALEVIIKPNPVKGGQLALQLNNFTKGSYGVNIYNSLSQVVYSQSIDVDGSSFTKSIILPGTIKAGIYSLQVVGDGIKITKSLVVE